jgi:hypothetical protein
MILLCASLILSFVIWLSLPPAHKISLKKFRETLPPNPPDPEDLSSLVVVHLPPKAALDPVSRLRVLRSETRKCPDERMEPSATRRRRPHANHRCSKQRTAYQRRNKERSWASHRERANPGWMHVSVVVLWTEKEERNQVEISTFFLFSSRSSPSSLPLTLLRQLCRFSLYAARVTPDPGAQACANKLVRRCFGSSLTRSFTLVFSSSETVHCL